MENLYTGANDPNNQNILDDADLSLYQASSGKRFANYLIDRVFFYILWRIFFAFIGLRLVTAMMSDSDSTTVVYIELYLLVIILDVTLWTLIEFLGGGKSIGKLITGTRAVNEDGTPITLKTAFLRSLSRIVPFEPFSALGNPAYPWHDRWTKTYVVDEKLSRLPQQQA